MLNIRKIKPFLKKQEDSDNQQLDNDLTRDVERYVKRAKIRQSKTGLKRS